MFSYDPLNNPVAGKADISIPLSHMHTTNSVSIYSFNKYVLSILSSIVHL